MCMYTSIARSQLIRGKNYGIYTEESYKKELTNINLQEEIQNGIEHFEFKAWFQPKYSVDGKALCGAEALARWEKNNEMISPNVFIPICEATGQIKNIDFLILDNVCKQLRKWIDEDKNIVPISVNMSRNYFDDPEILDNIAMILKFYNVPEQYVEFEITETSIENSEENFKNVINILHNRGHQIALDDFGIGYSSIKTVGTMGFDIIKLDKIFVDGIGNKKWEDIIIYAINLAKSVKAVVIAEGVENKKQLDFLAKNNCDIIQGYYFGKPMNCKEFEKLI